jgi:[ribosomal protein S5]-alanine N-acetyltransferase
MNRVAGAAFLPSLSDGVIDLRPFKEGDAPALAEIWRDPVIRARNRIPEASEKAARTWVAEVAARVEAREAWEWAVVDLSSGALAGRRALKEIDRKRGQAVAATWIAPGFRGRRFASRSLRLAAAHAFANGIVRIQAECDVDNPASIRSVLAAGMRYEHTISEAYVSDTGVPVDQHVFALVAENLATASPLP